LPSASGRGARMPQDFCDTSLLAGIGAAMLRAPAARPGHPFLAGRPVLCAHRGGGKLAPENTMEAFAGAIRDWGADMLELDVHASADGEIVVIHDDTVDRTTDGSGRVGGMPLAALRELDAGARFRDSEGRASFAGRGVRVPRLEEVIESFPRTRLTVEIKDVRAGAAVVALIERHGVAHRVLVAAAEERYRVGARGYPGPWGASGQQLRRFWILHRSPLSALYTPRADILQVPFAWRGRQIVTARFLAEAHRRNLAVHVWTVDDEPLMRLLLELGVDGIQSDRPDVLARVLTEVAGRPPPRGAAG
jgi:glycerophosphoryl diester phosphodiesterase